MADVVFLTHFSFALSLGAALANRDGDLGRHLRIGKWMTTEVRFPTVDVYSYTAAGGDIVPHEWLAQAITYQVFDWWGFDGIAVLVGIVVAVPWAMYARSFLTRGVRAGVVVPLVILGGAASSIHWVTRPHIFTFIFVAVWILLLDGYRTGRRSHVWWLVPLTVVWANTHGAFIVGLVLVATYLVGATLDRRMGHANEARPRHLTAVLLGSLAASLLNPVGLGLIANSFAYLGDDFLLEFTNEYNSPNFHQVPTWPFVLVLFAAVLIPWKRSATNVLLFTSWLAFALYSFRNIPIFALVVTPLLIEGLNSYLDRSGSGVLDRLPPRTRDPSWRAMHTSITGGVASVLIVVVTLTALTRSDGSNYGFAGDTFPIATMDVLADAPPGERVFNQFEWGGYLLFCCWPDIEVFIDGQTDYYGTELTQQYDLAVNAQPGWEDVLRTYSVDWVLVPPDAPLAEVLALAPGWTEHYRDAVAVAFAMTE